MTGLVDFLVQGKMLCDVLCMKNVRMFFGKGDSENFSFICTLDLISKSPDKVKIYENLTKAQHEAHLLLYLPYM